MRLADRILSITFNTVLFKRPHRTNRLQENAALIVGRATFSPRAALADDVVNDITRYERENFRRESIKVKDTDTIGENTFYYSYTKITTGMQLYVCISFTAICICNSINLRH